MTTEKHLKPQLYVSVDIESDGPIPGPHSMLSFGASAFMVTPKESGIGVPPGNVVSVNSIGAVSELGTFTRNLELLPGSVPDPSTSEFWAKNQNAYAATRTNLQAPETAMPEFKTWLQQWGYKPTFVGYPVTFDFMFVHWYMIKFAGEDPFGFQGLDMKTMTWVLQGCTSFHGVAKRTFPRHWFKGTHGHNHVALDDAVEQGVIFRNMLDDAAKLKAP